MSIHSRLLAIERIVSEATECEGRRTQYLEDCRRDFYKMLAHVPEHLCEAIFDARTRDSGTSHDISEWFNHPFARWAMPMREDYIFPEALVEFILNPPRDIWMGHNCGDCGLTVPLYYTWTNDPDPPKDLSCFPTCPACGGKTTFAACYGPGENSIQRENGTSPVSGLRMLRRPTRVNDNAGIPRSLLTP